MANKHEKGESKGYEAMEEASMKKTSKMGSMTVAKKKISGFTAPKKGK